MRDDGGACVKEAEATAPAPPVLLRSPRRQFFVLLLLLLLLLNFVARVSARTHMHT